MIKSIKGLNMAIQAEVVDGRRLRSERSKKAIFDACQALMNEGQLVPTAQRVSDKAGVPIRSFFRHFPDMETLFRALDESMRPEFERIFITESSDGTLAERIESAINLHARSFEENKAVLQSTKAQLWRYPVLQENYARWQSRLRKDLAKRIPELKDTDADTRELIDGIASYEMWDRLRKHQNLSVAKSSQLIQRLVENTLRDALLALKNIPL
jgi:AcrR family transcriptional regulator